jgi:hypothetical protein
VATPSERLEAEIWLEATSSDLSDCQREAFFRGVEEYYDVHPTAARGSDFLSVLQDDNCAFARILDAVIAGAHDSAGGAARRDRAS